MFEELMTELEERMDKALDALKDEFATIRTGRANVSLLEGLTVDYYGVPTPVTQVATVTVPEPRLLMIQPWDKSLLHAVEKAIQQSDLGLAPNNDGAIIRLNIPQLTEERRKDLVKVVHKRTEEARVAIRNIRRDGNDSLKKMEKQDGVSEDAVKSAMDKVQELTDSKMTIIDELMAAKEKDVMEV